MIKKSQLIFNKRKEGWRKKMKFFFPEIKDKKTSIEAVIERSKELLEERKADKKKPFKKTTLNDNAEDVNE